MRDWDSRLSYFPWQMFYIRFMNILCSMTSCFLFKNKRCLDWIFFHWPPKSRNSDWLIHNWAGEYSVMHSTTHFNGGHLKPRIVSLSHIAFKTIIDNYLQVFPLFGYGITDLFLCSVLFKVLHMFILTAAIIKPGQFTQLWVISRLRFASVNASSFVPDDRLWGWTIDDRNRLPFSRR